MPTPWSPLKVGASFDLLSLANQTSGTFGNSQNDSGWVVGLYGNYQATDKLSFNLRGEYFDLTGGTTPESFSGTSLVDYSGSNGRGEELTATVQYNLWANVTSRAEFRWDHADTGVDFYGAGDSSTANSYILALNVIYTF